MQDLNDLYYFVQVVEQGGFAPAGRFIGVPKSKLSRRIAELERRLGVRLLYRSTRRLSVTELGRRYYEHCVAMLVEADTAQEIIDRSIGEPQGLVRMACPPAMLHTIVADILTEFMVRYPRVRVVLEATGRRVDPVLEGFDLALRVRFPPLQDGELNHRVLFNSPQRLLAAPEVIARHAAPNGPEDLAEWPSVDWCRPEGRHMWILENSDGREVHVDHSPRLITDDLTTLYRGALGGLGIAQLPMLIARQAVMAGRLVDVLPNWMPRSGLVYVVFPSRRGLLPSVRLLIDFLAERFAIQDFETPQHRD